MRHRVGIAVVIVLASFFLGACSQQPALGEALDGSSKDVSDAPQTEGGGDPVAADSQLLNLDESIRDPVAFYSGDSAYLDDPGEQEITRIPTTDNESPIIFSGRIEEMNPEFWLIAGHHVRITDETEIIGDLSIGDLVKVHGFQRESVIVARVIKLLERPPQDRVVEFKGRVQELGEHIWLIGDHRVRVTEDTEIHGEIRVGDYVLVQGYLGNEGLVIARVIKLLERSP
ncbi:MAG: hypothetical protein IIC78_05880, partial [Chloroflexi bacterium]|nr:hypothetical protein [Chloroflexota bacterium]